MKYLISGIICCGVLLGSAYAYRTYSERKAAEEAQRIEEEKEKNARETDSLIEKIGDVTIDSGSAIETAEKSYDELTDDEKALVKKYDVLTAARSAYDTLLAEKENAEEIAKEIDGIGDVTLDKKDSIETISGKYQALSDTAKSYITNYDTLKEKEDTLNQMIETANAEKNEKIAAEKKAEDEKNKPEASKPKDTENTDTDSAPAPAENASNNGDTVNIDSDTGSVSVTDPAGWVTNTTLPDGTKIEKDNDDGSTYTRYPDGSTRYEAGDGRYVVRDSNGNVTDSNVNFTHDVEVHFGAE